VNTNKFRTQGSLSIISIIVIGLIVLGGAYAYIDKQADLHAQEAITLMIDDAKLQGVDVSYDAIDASPIARNITLQNFTIHGNEQEPDIILGKLVISGLNWQALANNNQNRLPLSMNLDITNGKIVIDETMVGDDPDLQAFVDVMGNELHFSTHANYKLDEATGLLSAAIIQSVNDNFSIKANLALGNTGWLAFVDANEPLISDTLTLDLLATTVNGLSITFKNDGLIEKIRAVTAKQTGLSSQQLTQQAVSQLRQMQSSLQDYSPVYSLMLEELIKFTQQPNQLLISIDPEQPLVSDDFLKVFMGGQSAPFDLMKKAQLFIKAN
jgi:hypothetical protein